MAMLCMRFFRILLGGVLLLQLLSACQGMATDMPAAEPATATLPSAVVPTAYLPLVTLSEPETLVQPNDFAYLGAFRLPGGDERPQTFAYGGNAMTFNPDRGSLFITGHDRMPWGELPDGTQIAEVSVPVPVKARDIEALPYATFLQDFHDVAAGHFAGLDEIPRVGLAYLNHPATGPLLHLAWGQHMPPEVWPPTHAWFGTDLATSNFQGEWTIGSQDFNSVNGYMFSLPTAWADATTQGRYLATGRFRDGGWGGMGPSLYAYTPWLADGKAPAQGTVLAETVLLRYESSTQTPNIERALANYQHPDEWEGGTWLTTATGKAAVLFAGTKGTGDKYWYGFIHPDGSQFPCIDPHADFTACRLANGSACPAEDMTGCCEEGVNCISGRGWWSARFDAQFILYDPAQLAQVAAGSLEPWQPQPYAVIDLDEHLYFNPPEWDAVTLGWGEQRRYRIGDVAFDNINGLLYVLELYADGAKPVVHVWRVA